MKWYNVIEGRLKVKIYTVKPKVIKTKPKQSKTQRLHNNKLVMKIRQIHRIYSVVLKEQNNKKNQRTDDINRIQMAREQFKIHSYLSP